MKLKKDSWYVWLYNYTYSNEVPNNICPLFWKLVLGILLFIPNVILRIPVSIGNYLNKKIKIEKGDNRTGVGIVIYLIIILIIFVIACIWNVILCILGYKYNDPFVVSGFILILFGLGWGIISLSKYISSKSRKKAKQRKNNIVKQYIKDWYDKKCTPIEWE